mmetsp:Transcript_60149/g.160076  ORF Transcript_60149/g.160076 Transcript_60149/m.160076 type:complete len:245 (-) Transcript_60149:2772-3506(-)
MDAWYNFPSSNPMESLLMRMLWRYTSPDQRSFTCNVYEVIGGPLSPSARNRRLTVSFSAPANSMSATGFGAFSLKAARSENSACVLTMRRADLSTHTAFDSNSSSASSAPAGENCPPWATERQCNRCSRSFEMANNSALVSTAAASMAAAPSTLPCICTGSMARPTGPVHSDRNCLKSCHFPVTAALWSAVAKRHCTSRRNAASPRIFGGTLLMKPARACDELKLVNRSLELRTLMILPTSAPL